MRLWLAVVLQLLLLLLPAPVRGLDEPFADASCYDEPPDSRFVEKGRLVAFCLLGW
jgi:hypothetical protein